MRLRLLGSVGLAVSLMISGAFGQAVKPALVPPVAVADHPVPADAVRALTRAYVADDKTPGIVIAYARGDRPPMIAAAGAIASDAGAPKADADSLWRVFSMTKPITGMAAMMLVEDGKLSLDQPVGDFIPGFRSMRVLTDPANGLASRPAARPITIRHLLTHTAGLAYSIVDKGPIKVEYERLGLVPAALIPGLEPELRKVRPTSLMEFADRVATLPLTADPGTKWSYSISLDVLARVIEVAGGLPFEQFLTTRMFGPLGMKSTFWTVPPGDTARLSTAYVWPGATRIPIDPGKSSVFSTPPSFPYGGAGLVMSARDYDRFLHMLVNQGRLDGVRVMKASTVQLAMSNLLPSGVAYQRAPGGSGGDAATPTGYGAGGMVYLVDMPGGPARGSYGWGGAAGTIAWVDPVNKVRATIMVNYLPPDKWPLRADATRAIYRDLAH